MQPVLLITDGLFHPPSLARALLHKTLRRSENFQFSLASSIERLRQGDAADFAALVLYYHHRKISPEALSVFERYVDGGGGVLALHSATASFKQRALYAEILGGKFSGHGPVESFRVERADAAKGGPQALFAGVEPFTLRDEVYQHELVPDAVVHFEAVANGQRTPLVWTRAYGRGRVCYVGPGHISRSLRHPALQQILLSGLAWAAGAG